MLKTLLITTALASQPQCGEKDEIFKQLLQQYHEKPISFGLSTRGNMTIVTASPDGATWTVVGVNPDGQACLFDAGEGWTMKPGDPS